MAEGQSKEGRSYGEKPFGAGYCSAGGRQEQKAPEIAAGESEKPCKSAGEAGKHGESHRTEGEIDAHRSGGLPPAEDKSGQRHSEGLEGQGHSGGEGDGEKAAHAEDRCKKGGFCDISCISHNAAAFLSDLFFCIISQNGNDVKYSFIFQGGNDKRAAANKNAAALSLSKKSDFPHKAPLSKGSCRHEVTTEGIEKARKIVSFLMPYNPLRHAFGVPPPLIKGRLSKVFRQSEHLPCEGRCFWF